MADLRFVADDYREHSIKELVALLNRFRTEIADMETVHHRHRHRLAFLCFHCTLAASLSTDCVNHAHWHDPSGLAHHQE